MKYKISEQTLQLENYLKSLSSGTYLAFHVIEKETGIKMDEKGKGYLRSALNKLKIEYTAVIGQGIELASSKNSINIVSKRVIKVDNSVRKAEITTKRIQKQFYRELPEEEQKNILFLSSVFSTLRAYSKSAKTFSKKQDHKIINI